MELQFEKAKTVVTPKGIFLTELYRALFRTYKQDEYVSCQIVFIKSQTFEFISSPLYKFKCY